jgi:hypothetical protein
MKTLAVSFVLALGLTAPALAEPPAPAPATTETAADTASADLSAPIDALVELATTPEERAALLRRCAGPPPKMIAQTQPAKEQAVEPAVVAQAGTGDSGG